MKISAVVEEAATRFVLLWKFLKHAYGATLALMDSRLQRARFEYLEAACT